VVHLKRIPSGARVGYHGAWRAARDSTIALLPVGYADGYPVACGSDHAIHQPAHVRLQAVDGACADAPVVGAVNMDQITIDVTDVPESLVRLGSLVEIYSPTRSAPNHIPTLARRIGTPPHELLTRLGAHIPRRYLSLGATVETCASASITSAASLQIPVEGRGATIAP
jgi:alanine racemase